MTAYDAAYVAVAGCLGDLVEGASELGVTVAKQEAGSEISILELPGQVAPVLADEVGPRAVAAAGSGWDSTAAKDLGDTHVCCHLGLRA